MRRSIFTLGWLLLVTACRVALEESDTKSHASEQARDEMTGGAGKPANRTVSSRTAGTSSATANARAAAAGAESTQDSDEGRGVNPDGSFHCDDVAELRPTQTIGGDIGGELDLSGVIRVTGAIDGRGGKITVAPGTVFLMESGSTIDFTFSNATTLQFKGTATRPIRFCGAKAQSGYWRGIHLGRAASGDGLTPDSVLEHVLISGAGANGSTGLVLSKEAKLVNVQVRNSEAHGMNVTKLARGSADLWVDRVKGFPLVLATPDALEFIPIDSKLTNNPQNRVLLTFVDIRTGTVVFPKLAASYLQEKSIDVGTAKLVFEAGVEYRLGSGVTLNVGFGDGAAELQVRGTEAAPVVFRGEEDKPGFWGTLNVRQGVVPASKIEHARILQGGVNGAAPLLLNATITLNDVSVEDAGGPVTIGAAPSATSKNLSISGAIGAPLTLPFALLPNLPSGGTLHDNAKPAILVSGEYAKPVGTVPNLGAPYAISAVTNLEGGTDLSFAPGVELVFSTGSGVFVGWNGEQAKLKAIGTAAQPILFRGAEDTLGYWNGITIGTSATADSGFDHVQVKNAGLVLRRSIPVTNSSFSKSAGFGILKSAGDMTDYRVTNVFADNTSGPVGM